MKQFRVTLLLSAALALSSAALASDTSDIKAVYTTLGNAMKSSNFESFKSAIMSISAPGFTYYGIHGEKQSGEEVMSMFKQQMAMTKQVLASNFAAKTIKVTGNKATVMSASTWKGKVMWMDKKVHVLSSDDTSEDMLVKIGGKWKVKEVHIKTENTTLDGKPLKM